VGERVIKFLETMFTFGMIDQGYLQKTDLAVGLAFFLQTEVGPVMVIQTQIKVQARIFVI
jgi:hypothetical protein